MVLDLVSVRWKMAGTEHNAEEGIQTVFNEG